MSISESATGATPRSPGTAQGILLSIAAMVTIAAALLITPALPLIVAHYLPNDPNAEAKVLLALSIPALIVALTSSFIGIYLDRFGRKKPLVVCLTAYGIVGMLPGLVELDLNVLIGLRILSGVFEAVVMVSATTLIGDYWYGAEQRKWYIMQSVILSISAIILIGIGGALGEIAWNAPFLAYGLFLLVVPFCMFLLHEPEKHAEEPPAGKFPWKDVIGSYGFGFTIAVLIMLMPVQLPFLLTERGTGSPFVFGAIGMAGGIAILVGNLYFKARSYKPFKTNLVSAYFVVAAGLALVVFSGASLPLTVLGVIIVGLGNGFLMPCIITEIMQHLKFEERGRGSGRWITCYFTGNFLSPLIVLGITMLVGGLSNTLLLMAAVAFTCAMIGLVFIKKRAPLFAPA